MHPDLLNNPIFIRYYKRWQEDPESILFVPIAELFLKYGMAREAVKICREGLKKFPDIVSGRLALAKAYFAQSDWKRSCEEVERVLKMVPGQPQALELKTKISMKVGTQESDLNENVLPKPLKYDVFDDDEEITEEVDMEVFVDDMKDTAGFEEGGEFENWNTLTMARIFASQGHYDRAVKIYGSILERDPENRAAADELNRLREKMNGI